MWVWVQCHLLNCKWDTLFQMQRRKRTHVSYIMQICWRIMNRFVILALETGTWGGHSSLLDTSTVYLHSISPQTPESSESGPDLSLRNWVEWGKVTGVTRSTPTSGALSQLPSKYTSTWHHPRRNGRTGRLGWLESHLGETGQVGNATGVVFISSQENISFVSPAFSPAVEPIEKNT